MAFTDAEMAVLSQFVYDNKAIKMNVSLHDLLMRTIKDKNGKVITMAESLKKELGKQYSDVIDGLVEKSKNYRVVLSKSDELTGFDAMAIAGPDNEVTVVCRGTEGFDILHSEESRKDVFKGDYGLIEGNGETAQHKQMEQFLDELDKKGYKEYSFTGHSLGGNLAMYGAIYMAKKRKINKVVTFNAPNFNTAFVNKHKEEIDIIRNKTTLYQNEYDIVSSINEENAFGDKIVCESLDDDSNPMDFKDHLLSNYDISDGNLVPNASGEKSDFTKSLGQVGTDGDIILTAGIALFAVKSAVTGFSLPAIVASAGTALVFVASLVVTVAVVSYVYNKVKKWLYEHSKGYKYATANPCLSINTTTMSSYASQLRTLSNRSKTLDRKMNNMYLHLGIEWDTIANLGRLFKSGIILDFAVRLDKCANYLDKTAEDFNKVERELNSLC